MRRPWLRAIAGAWPAALLTGQAWCAGRAFLAYTHLPVLTTSRHWSDLEPVSIIVPARNETTNLPVLLPSLDALAYPSFEIIVVDDSSTDDTADIAAARGVRVIRAGPLPRGWTGKPHACSVGARQAAHPWLLFTDADTEHASTSLAAAMAYVRVHQLQALSVFCGQRCESVWERLLLPYAYRHFFAGVDSCSANDPEQSDALANGQYMLIARAAYDRIGGHGAVRDSIVEDVALAAIFKREGVPYRIVRTERLVRVRMYRGLAEIRAGFAKNSARFLAQDPARGALVMLSTVLDGASAGLILAGAVTGNRRLLLGGLASWAMGSAGLWPWQSWFSVRGRHALAQPFTAMVFQVIALEGLRALRPGSTEWKGRRY